MERHFFSLLPVAFTQEAKETKDPSPIQSGFERWWNGSSALPEVDIRMKETHSRKLRKREGSVIPESSLRQDLADAGVSFMGSFTAYFLGNVSGGLTRDFAYNHMLFFQLNLDLEKIMNWKGGTIVWSFADNAGSDLSTAVGNNFQISTDYGPNTFMFDEFYFMQTLLDGKLHIKLHNAPEGHFWMHPRARSSHHLIPTEGSVLSQEPEPPAPPKA